METIEKVEKMWKNVKEIHISRKADRNGKFQTIDLPLYNKDGEIIGYNIVLLGSKFNGYDAVQKRDIEDVLKIYANEKYNTERNGMECFNDDNTDSYAIVILLNKFKHKK